MKYITRFYRQAPAFQNMQSLLCFLWVVKSQYRCTGTWYAKANSTYMRSLSYNIARMSNDSLSCKYQGSKVFIDYLIDEYLVYRLYLLYALTYHVPAQRYWPIFRDIRQRKERLHNVGEQNLVGRNDRYYVFQRSDSRRALSKSNDSQSCKY